MRKHLIFCIDDVLALAADNLHGNEDLCCRPRILEALALAGMGNTETEAVVGLLYIAHEHGRLTLDRIYSTPLPPDIREALRQPHQNSLVDDPHPFHTRNEQIQRCLESPSARNREGARMAIITICRSISLKERRLKADLADCLSVSEEDRDPGLDVHISYIQSKLKDLSRKREIMVEKFGEKWFGM
jgi:hypothetical protein